MTEQIKIKWLIGYLIIFSLIFAAHSYFLYFEYIPKVLAPFAGNDVVYAHVQRALYTLASFMRAWFLVLVGSAVGLIIRIHIAAKKSAKNSSQDLRSPD